MMLQNSTPIWISYLYNIMSIKRPENRQTNVFLFSLLCLDLSGDLIASAGYNKCINLNVYPAAIGLIDIRLPIDEQTVEDCWHGSHISANLIICYETNSENQGVRVFVNDIPKLSLARWSGWKLVPIWMWPDTINHWEIMICMHRRQTYSLLLTSLRVPALNPGLELRNRNRGLLA